MTRRPRKEGTQVTSRPAAAQHLRDLARLRRVRDRIDREDAQPLDLEALARGVHVSAGHLSRQFRRAYGESPYSYLMTRRIERAMALLRGDTSVTEVCFAVGRASLGSFSSRFTELVGMPPSTYRRQAAQATVGLPPWVAKAGSATRHHHQPTRAACPCRHHQAKTSTTKEEPIVAQQVRTPPQQPEGAPAARAARWALRAVITVTALAVALAACSNSSDPVGSVAAGPATGAAAKIQAVDGNRFTPKTLQLPADKQVTIQITNADNAAHVFAIEAADLNTGTIAAGAVATATFTVPEGTTEFVCTFHRGMTGTIQGV
jgi:AraC-like DNA-binding protein/plastocyanin